MDKSVDLTSQQESFLRLSQENIFQMKNWVEDMLEKPTECVKSLIERCIELRENATLVGFGEFEQYLNSIKEIFVNHLKKIEEAGSCDIRIHLQALQLFSEDILASISTYVKELGVHFHDHPRLREQNRLRLSIISDWNPIIKTPAFHVDSIGSDFETSVPAHIIEEKEECTSHEYIVLKIGPQQFAAPVTKIVEIISWQKIYSLPCDRSNMLGIFNFRGEALPVVNINQRLRLSVGEKSFKEDQCLVIGTVHHHAFAFPVDEVDRVLKLDPNQFEKTSAISTSFGTKYVSQMVLLDEKPIFILDLEGLVAS